MNASAILISTVLTALAVMAIALLTGSLALLTSRQDPATPTRGGVAESLRTLDRQWHIERLVYRHHRLFGLLVMAAAVFFLWQLFRADPAWTAKGSGITPVLIWTLVCAQAINLLIGAVIMLRPSLIKPLESIGNRWHRLELSGQRSPESIRVTATLLALVGLTVLVGSAMLLMHQLAVFFE